MNSKTTQMWHRVVRACVNVTLADDSEIVLEQAASRSELSAHLEPEQDLLLYPSQPHRRGCAFDVVGIICHLRCAIPRQRVTEPAHRL